MQKLKDDIKKRIDDAAIQLFRAHGFQGVSMRRIAENADMTVGNIYRYYKNKDELFTSLILPSFNEIKDLFELWNFKSIEQFIEDGHKFSGVIIDTFLKIHSKYQNELFILVHGCEGSSILNPVQHVRDLLARRLMFILEYHFAGNDNIDVVFFSELTAQNIINSNIQILYEFGNDVDRRNHLMEYVQINIGSLLSIYTKKEK